MGLQIRQVAAEDAPLWLELARVATGDDYLDKRIYDREWIATQLDPRTGHETWVAEDGDLLHASISFLSPIPANRNPIANLGRVLVHPSCPEMAVQRLLATINALVTERQQLAVIRVLASDNPLQIQLENQGYVCAGFQPYKHMFRVREGVLFYVWFSRPDALTRLPISESLAQVSELAAVVLDRLNISNPITVRDGVTGYPLQSELQLHEATAEDFELWRLQAQSSNPAPELSGGYNIGLGLMRTPSDLPLHAVLGQREDQVVAGLSYYYDELDRCVRLVDCFTTDDLSTGVLLTHMVKLAQEQLSALYVEVDVVVTAPRLLKSAEQLGFVPVAYLPAFYFKGGRHADVVKLVKLNMVYSPEANTVTNHARQIVDIIDRNLEDQKIGVAIINLLRALPIFEGLGDGELRKIARLCQQKLYRPGERVFGKGDSGIEAYVVMRGQIDIFIEEASRPIASVANGQILGELAFLDGIPRVAVAVANQASILLVIQRSAFNQLVQREPHLGMVVMRNIALELSNRLRRSNVALSVTKR
jgi:hypothetical protein